jgi:hypothetical protein
LSCQIDAAGRMIGEGHFAGGQGVFGCIDFLALKEAERAVYFLCKWAFDSSNG